MSIETKTPEMLPPGDYGVQDIVEADIDIEDRLNDGLHVVLWMRPAVAAEVKRRKASDESVDGLEPLYVTVEDRKGLPVGVDGEKQYLAVPWDHNPYDGREGRFVHPMKYLA